MKSCGNGIVDRRWADVQQYGMRKETGDRHGASKAQKRWDSYGQQETADAQCMGPYSGHT